MTMYRALSFFTDNDDGGHPYEKGDVYPRPGLSPTASRINELAGRGNVRGVPVIGLVNDDLTEKKPNRTRNRKNAD